MSSTCAAATHTRVSRPAMQNSHSALLVLRRARDAHTRPAGKQARQTDSRQSRM